MKEKKTGNNSRSFAAVSKAGSVRYPVLWLTVVTFIVYIQTVTFGYTDLDDGILIRKFASYNQDLGNLITSFQRSILNTATDIYYRPVTLNVMLLNYQLCGENIGGYHLVNLLLHLAAVLLLYRLFHALGINVMAALMSVLVFAVHPLLVPAVAWVPGRNDVLLSIFVFAFLSATLSFSNTGKIGQLIASVLCLLLAVFTKETAVFAPFVAFVMLALKGEQKWTAGRYILLYTLWVACVVAWLCVRRLLHIDTGSFSVVSVLQRLPVLIQYYGKIIFPLNLSVYPLQQDTSYIPGITAIVATVALIGYAVRKRRMSREKVALMVFGFTLFLLFSFPTLLVPASISKELFEYRLYLPAMGVILAIGQTIPVPESPSREFVFVGALVTAILVMLNFNYQRSFDNPLHFWRQAAATAPHSAHAQMMLAARTADQGESDSLFLYAFNLDPNEKYLNYIYAVRLQNRDSVLASEPYLLKEKKITNYNECDFLLARVAVEKKDFTGAVQYLQAYLKNEPSNEAANDNLLALYLNTDQDSLAKIQAKRMIKLGMQVDPRVRQAFGM